MIDSTKTRTKLFEHNLYEQINEQINAFLMANPARRIISITMLSTTSLTKYLLIIYQTHQEDNGE